MRQLELFPEPTFEIGDRVQCIEKSMLNKKGTVISIQPSILVKFDKVGGWYYCSPESLEHI